MTAGRSETVKTGAWILQVGYFQQDILVLDDLERSRSAGSTMLGLAKGQRDVFVVSTLFKILLFPA